jgi:hypothetical protein
MSDDGRHPPPARTDPACCQEILKVIKAEKKAIVRDAPGADNAALVLQHVISIVEHSLAEDSPSAKTKRLIRNS